jgi:hypothetical protein
MKFILNLKIKIIIYFKNWQKSKFWLLITIFSLTFFLLILRRWLPLNTLAAYFDDALFVNRAEFILSGNLGLVTSGYNALVKGTLYPWFIVLTKLLGFNPVFFTYFLLILIVLFLGYLIFIMTKNWYFGALIFILVIADPLFFTDSASRILREITQQNFILLLILCINTLIFSKDIMKISNYTKYLIGIFIGIILALTLNIREENIWIFSALILNLFIVIILRFRFLYLFPIIFTIILSTFISVQAIKNFNNFLYDVKLQNTTTEGEFPEMMLNLSGIYTPVGERRYVAIDKNKRKLAYQVSPTFKLLEPNLEGPGQAWVQFGCQDSQTCDDYANGWFHVALREAMKELGWWQSEIYAQEMMAKVNNEISVACQSSVIECRRGIPFGAPYGNQFLNQKEVLAAWPYFKKYVQLSLNNWSAVRRVDPTSIYKTEVMPEDLYTSWRKTLPNMPFAQITYIEKFNSRYLAFQPYLNVWSNLYSFMMKFLLLINLISILSLLFKVSRQYLNTFIITLYFIFLYLWISKGFFLALNSAINFNSISVHYALSSRVFLSCFLVLGIIHLLTIFSKYREKDRS